jgi:hypothetical protein
MYCPTINFCLVGLAQMVRPFDFCLECPREFHGYTLCVEELTAQPSGGLGAVCTPPCKAQVKQSEGIFKW